MATANPALWYVGGMLVLLIALQVMAKPLAVLLRLMGNGLVGGAALWVLNFIGASVQFHIGLNPVSAILVGALGVPGLMGLGIIRLLLR